MSIDSALRVLEGLPEKEQRRQIELLQLALGLEKICGGADFPVMRDGQSWASNGNVSGSETGATVTASGSANTKGSWTQIFASTSHPSMMVGLSFGLAGNADADYLIDVGVGAGGSEQVVVPNVHFRASTTGGMSAGHCLFPISIPAGSRVAVRIQCTTGSSTLDVEAQLMAGGLEADESCKMTDYGTDTATSKGAAVSSGGVLHTKGSWVQLSSSTTFPVSALVLAMGGNASTTSNTNRFLVDIGVGGAGSEQVVIPDIGAGFDGIVHILSQQFFGPFPLQIPAGTRLAARCSSSRTTAPNTVDVIAYGVS